jgi:Ion channel
MLSALLMLHRVVRAVGHAIREEDFLPVASAGVLLVFVGTLSYSLGEDWNVVDAFYFAVSTLTTTSVADPELVLEHRWMKVFTVFYLLIGIGILVEILRRLGAAFVAVRAEDKARSTGAATRAEP